MVVFNSFTVYTKPLFVSGQGCILTHYNMEQPQIRKVGLKTAKPEDNVTTELFLMWRRATNIYLWIHTSMVPVD